MGATKREPRQGSRGGSRRAPWLAGLLGGLALGGCTLHQAGVTPPDNRIFFPSGGVVDPEGRWLYVVNANSDLRYNAGTIVVIDLKAAGDAYSDGLNGNVSKTLPPAGPCSPDPRYVPPPTDHTSCWDTTDPNILNVDDQLLINSAATVRIGSFAGTPVIQTFPDGPDVPTDATSPTHALDRRLFIPVRGDTSITFMNLDHGDGMTSPKLWCTGARQSPDPVKRPAGLTQEPFAACDDTWRITREQDPLEDPSGAHIPDDQVVKLPDEPYSLTIDETTNLLFVGHLRGYISLIDASINDPLLSPALIDRTNGVIPGDASGSIGVTSLTIHPSTQKCGKEIYASSRFRPVASSFVVYGLSSDRCAGTPVSPPPMSEGLVIVPTGATLSTGVAGSDTRGIEFVNSKYIPPGSVLPPSAQNQNSSPDRAFLIQRNPPTLVGIDLSTQLPLSTMEICQGPTHLAQPTDSQGNPLFGVPLLFITCFDSGELYIVDPAVPQIRTVIPVGREPINTVFNPNDPTRAYVMTFGGNNVTVVDLDPLSRTVNRVIQRIGFPSATPRDLGPQ